MDNLNFENAYAAIGRALDAFCYAGDRPLSALPEFSPLYGLHLGKRLLEEEQKTPHQVGDLLNSALEGVVWTVEEGGTALPHRHVEELLAALGTASNALTALTDFRVSLVGMVPLRGDAVKELEERDPLLPLTGPERDPEWLGGQLVPTDLPDSWVEDVEALGELSPEELDQEVTDEEYAAEEMVPVEPPQWVKDGLAAADAAMEETGRYLHLPPEMEAMADNVLEAAGALGLAARQAQAEREGDTAEMEAVPEGAQQYVELTHPKGAEALPGHYVTLIDGVSTVAKPTVLAEAKPVAVEKLQRGDVIPGHDFYLVETTELTVDAGSQQVKVTYTNGKARGWFPGTMVTAYRP